MDLQKGLLKLKEQVEKQLPDNLNESNKRFVAELAKNKKASKGPQEGDSLNLFQQNFNFELPDGAGKLVKLTDQISRGPVVLSFYRGGWCPFCNLELKFLKAESLAFQKLGAQLIAISPENSDNSLTTIQMNELNFFVLSDLKNTVAKALGISYVVPEYLKKAYLSYGLDLVHHNSVEKVELPIPATYVIDQQMIVRYAFASEDFTKRAKITRIIKALEEIKAEGRDELMVQA